MTPEQLRIFVAVAERGHVTARRSCSACQSGQHSRRHQGAGNRAAACCFRQRRPRHRACLRRGAGSSPEAKAVLERIAEARHVLENASQTIAGSIAIAASQTIASYWLPRRLAAFQDSHPAVRAGRQASATPGRSRTRSSTARPTWVSSRVARNRIFSAAPGWTSTGLMLVVAKSHPGSRPAGAGRARHFEPALDRPRGRLRHARGAAGPGAPHGHPLLMRSHLSRPAEQRGDCPGGRGRRRRNHHLRSRSRSRGGGRFAAGTCRWRCLSAEFAVNLAP